MSPVVHALTEPEAFTQAHSTTVPLSTLAALAGTATVGVACYGAAMHAWAGAPEMLRNAGVAVAAAGGAWTSTIPAIFVLGGWTGSRLRLRALLLTTLVTVSFGGLAMLASIPVLLLAEMALPDMPAARWLFNLVIFAGVGTSMADVYLRVTRALEIAVLRPLLWLCLISVIGAELFWAFGLFDLR